MGDGGFEFGEYLTPDYCLSCAYFRQQKGHFGSCYEDPRRGIYDGTKQGSACAGWRVKTEWAEEKFDLQEQPFPKRTKFTVKGAIDPRTWQGKNGVGSTILSGEEERIHALYNRLDLHKVEIHKRQRDEAERTESNRIKRQSLHEMRLEADEIWDDPVEQARRYIRTWQDRIVVGPLSLTRFWTQTLDPSKDKETTAIVELVIQMHVLGWSRAKIQGWFLAGVRGPPIDIPDEGVDGCIMSFHKFCEEAGAQFNVRMETGEIQVWKRNLWGESDEGDNLSVLR